MRVTLIKYKKKYSDVTFEDNIILAISNDVISELNLENEQDISLKKIKEANFDFALKYAMEISLKALTRASYTEHQLREKLKNKHIQYDAIDETINKLKGYNYINDERFAEIFVSDNINLGKSKAEIRQKLKQKGVDVNISDDALEEYSNEDEVLNIKKFIEKNNNILKSHPPQIRKIKLTEKAMRHGYPMDLVKNQIETILEYEDDDDYEQYYINKITKRIASSKKLPYYQLINKLYKEFIPIGAPKQLIDDLAEELTHTEEQ